MSLSEQSFLQSLGANLTTDKTRISPKSQGSESLAEPVDKERSFSKAFDQEINAVQRSAQPSNQLSDPAQSTATISSQGFNDAGLDGSNADGTGLPAPEYSLLAGDITSEAKPLEGIDNWLNFIKASAAGGQDLRVDLSAAPLVMDGGDGQLTGVSDLGLSLEGLNEQGISANGSAGPNAIFVGSQLLGMPDEDIAQSFDPSDLASNELDLIRTVLPEGELRRVLSSVSELAPSSQSVLAMRATLGTGGKELNSNQSALNVFVDGGEEGIADALLADHAALKSASAEAKTGGLLALNNPSSPVLKPAINSGNLTLQNADLAFKGLMAGPGGVSAGQDSAAFDLSALMVDDSQVLDESLLSKTTLSQFSSSTGSVSQPGAGLEFVGSTRVAVPVNVQFGHERWTAAIAEQTAKLAAQSIQTAEIQMDPPELGPLTVKIHVQNDQATVNFNSSHAVVRDALEQTMARLREMLSEQGMDLVDSGVSDFSQQGQGESEQQASYGEGGVDEVDEKSELNAAPTYTLNSGIDYFV